MTRPATAHAAAREADTMTHAYKAFNPDWTCRGFQFEVGKTYKHDGPVEPCKAGFHACIDPFDVLSYYGYDGKFAEVELRGERKPHGEDSKIAAAEITIKAELSLPDFIKRGVEYILSKVDWANATETSTGDRAASTSTGDRAASTSTGDLAASTSTGDRAASTSTGKDSVALASGYEGRVAGANGCALFLVERDDDLHIVAAWAGIVGRDGIKPGTFYTLKDGKPVEVEASS